MLTFRRFLRAAALAHPHPFVRDFAHDAERDASFPRTPTHYRHVKAAASRGCRGAQLGAALAWRTYQAIVRDVVVSR